MDLRNGTMDEFVTGVKQAWKTRKMKELVENLWKTYCKDQQMPHGRKERLEILFDALRTAD